jgi:hypothetical protein
MRKMEQSDGAIVVVPRSTVVSVWQALSEAALDLPEVADSWSLPAGAAAALEGHATVIRIALDELTRVLDPETTARAAHPAGRAGALRTPD